VTAICPSGGPSASKPGFNITVVTTGAAVEGALILLGLDTIAAVIGPIIAGEVYDLTTFCTVDPPSTPTLTAQDLFDILDFADPTVFLPALSKWRQWFDSWFWFQVCECTGATTPAAPALTAPALSTNPTLPPGPPASPCWNVLYTQNETHPTGGGVQDLSARILPTGPTQTVNVAFTGAPTSAFLVPTGAISYDSFVTENSKSGGDFNGHLLCYNSAGNVLQDFALWSINHGVGTTQHSTSTLPSGTTAWAVVESYSATAGTTSETYDFTINCNNNTGTTPSTPCCSPDTNLDAKLNAIIGMCQAILNGLPAVPTTFHTGTVHSGLSGSGAISLAAAPFAIQVDITTDPSNLGVDAGNPSFLFDRGFIVSKIGTASILEERRLTYNPQWIFLPELTETVGYTLHPGVTISITELQPN